MAKKNPTNADILKVVEGMNTRLTSLESWRIGQEAGTAAVKEYRRAENEEARTKSWIEITKQLAPFIVAATAVLYALAHGLGK